MDLDTEVVDDPDAGTTCGCGRVRATAHDFVRWCSAVSPDRPYGGSPSTWQNVRLGRCRPPNEAHLDPAYPAWALALCWTPGDRCQLPKTSGLASDDPAIDPLRPMPMTPDQVADIVARARANTRPHRVETGRRNRARWDRWRAAQGR